jgi:hypothetical protein
MSFRSSVRIGSEARQRAGYSSIDGSINGTLIDALESGRINTKIRIAYLGGAHAERPLLAQRHHTTPNPGLSVSRSRKLRLHLGNQRLGSVGRSLGRILQAEVTQLSSRQ